MKNYYYRDDSEGVVGARVEAFANWKAIYNLSMCMTYGRFSLVFLSCRSMIVDRFVM